MVRVADAAADHSRCLARRLRGRCLPALSGTQRARHSHPVRTVSRARGLVVPVGWPRRGQSLLLLRATRGLKPVARRFRVGLTGGIASGKTTVANLFAGLGVPIIDTDMIAREILEPGTPLLDEVVAHFGRGVVAADGSLDRRALRTRVFADPAERHWLEERTHPAIRALTDARCETAIGPYSI